MNNLCKVAIAYSFITGIYIYIYYIVISLILLFSTSCFFLIFTLSLCLGWLFLLFIILSSELPRYMVHQILLSKVFLPDIDMSFVLSNNLFVSYCCVFLLLLCNFYLSEWKRKQKYLSRNISKLFAVLKCTL